MRLRNILTITVTSLVLLAGALAPVSADPSRVTHDEVERAVLRVFNSGRALRQIDRAFEAGALTWSEARDLYAEQTAIRGAYIRGKGLHGPVFAARRAAFMLRVAQGTYAQLAYNSDQRKTVQRQVTWAW